MYVYYWLVVFLFGQYNNCFQLCIFDKTCSYNQYNYLLYCAIVFVITFTVCCCFFISSIHSSSYYESSKILYSLFAQASIVQR